MIYREPAAKRNRAIFLKERNDIDIYVEDTSFSSEKFYVQFFNNVFEGKFKIKDVFPCGNKFQVIDMARKKARSARRIGRPQIFIVDGDLELISCSAASICGVVRWPVYCVENYLLDEQAIVNVIDRFETTMAKADISARLDFRNWLNSNVDAFMNLYPALFICFMYKISVKVMKNSISLSSSGRIGLVDPVKVSDEIRFFNGEALKRMDGYVFLRVHGDVTRHLAGQSNRVRFVSGKAHLLPLLFERIRTLFSVRFDDNAFKQQLAGLCDCRDARELVFREISRQGFM